MNDTFTPKFAEQLFKGQKDYLLEYTPKSITIRAVNFVATLRISEPISKSYKNDIINAPDAEVALKWLYVIASKDKKSSMSIEQRPSWCKSWYNNEKEYREVKEQETNQVVNQTCKLAVAILDGIQVFDFKPYHKTTFHDVRYPHQTHRFKHFLTWEEWSGPKGVALDFYVRNNTKSDTKHHIKENKSNTYTKPWQKYSPAAPTNEIKSIESLLGDLFKDNK